MIRTTVIQSPDPVRLYTMVSVSGPDLSLSAMSLWGASCTLGCCTMHRRGVEWWTMIGPHTITMDQNPHMILIPVNQWF